MRKTNGLLIVAAAVASLVFGGAAVAGTPSLGSSIAQVKAIYTDAAPVAVAGGRQALELRDVEYGGIHWSSVDFVFDQSNHLQSLTMRTSEAKYDRILAIVQTQPNDTTGMLAANEFSTNDDLQIRVCESDNGEVSLTYEPVTFTT